MIFNDASGAVGGVARSTVYLEASTGPPPRLADVRAAHPLRCSPFLLTNAEPRFRYPLDAILLLDVWCLLCDAWPRPADTVEQRTMIGTHYEKRPTNRNGGQAGLVDAGYQELMAFGGGYKVLLDLSPAQFGIRS